MIYGLLIPVGLLVVPWLLVRFVFTTKQTKGLPYLQHAKYLWAAAIVWWLALILPNPPWSETDTFTMHTTGGVVAAILFFYVTDVYKIRFTNAWIAAAVLYFFVSGLGVLNELFEFFLDVSRIKPMPHGDTWWDLFANTLGGFLAFGVLSLVKRFRR